MFLVLGHFFRQKSKQNLSSTSMTSLTWVVVAIEVFHSFYLGTTPIWSVFPMEQHSETGRSCTG